MTGQIDKRFKKYINLNMREKVSVIIPTWDKDLAIVEGAIKSVLWADEVILVDSSCSKKVEAVAKKWNLVYFARQMKNWAEQKNWAILKVKHKWVIILDSDEVITDKLTKTFKSLLKNESINDYDGYGVARKHFFFGKFLRWGGRYPLYNIRLFKQKCRYEKRDVHEHIVLKKKQIKNIKPKFGDMLHFGDRNFSQFFQRFESYSTHQADYMLRIIKRKKTEINWIEFFTNFYYFKSIVKDYWFFIPGTSISRFIWMYIIRFGFLDGRYGFIIALFYGFQDYVAKLKFKERYKGKSLIRAKFIDCFMEKITPALLKNSRLEKDYIRGYQKVFMAIK